MKRSGVIFSIFTGIFMMILVAGFGQKAETAKSPDTKGNLKIGWASVDITPDKPVLLAGQFHVRVSEGVLDPLSVTALAFESGTGPSSGKAIMISCDIVSISNILRDTVRTLLKERLPEVNPDNIFLNATHTHTAPTIGLGDDIERMYGLDLGVLTPKECLGYISDRIAKAAVQAWENRKAGGISYGLGQAVVGHNRHTVDLNGKAVMYKMADFPEFSHVEGYEDHSVNLLYTCDTKGKLTGVIINVGCPSQVTEGINHVSADYWHETREEVRKRLGNGIFILPQCSAAGDQAPHIQVGEKAEARMQDLMGEGKLKSGRTSMGQRKQIAIRLADAVTSVYTYVKNKIDWNPEFGYKMEVVEISRRKRTPPPAAVNDNKTNTTNQNRVDTTTYETYKKIYTQLIQEVKDNPDIKKTPGWYLKIIDSYTKMRRSEGGSGNTSRFASGQRSESGPQPEKFPVEVNVIRLGDVVFATNPFELYLDYGMRIKGRSPSMQTFIVQLAGGHASYLPTARGIQGGSYGAANTRTGPEGGQELVEKTLEMINSVWTNN